MTEPYKYVHFDPEAPLPPSNLPPYVGSRVHCLRDALLDVIHAGLDTGMTLDEVDEALAEVVDHVAGLHRGLFKVHIQAR